MERSRFTKEDLTLALARPDTSRSSTARSNVLTSEITRHDSAQAQTFDQDDKQDQKHDQKDVYEVSQLKSIIKALGAKVQETLEEKYNLQRDHTRDLEAQNTLHQTLKEEIRYLQELNKTLTDKQLIEKQEHTERLQKKSQEVDLLKKELQSLEQAHALKSANNQKESFDSKLQSAQREITQREVAKYEQAQEQFSKIRSELTIQISNLQQEKHELSNRFEDLKKELKVEILRKNKEIELKNHELESSRENAKNLEDQVSKLENQLSMAEKLQNSHQKHQAHDSVQTNAYLKVVIEKKQLEDELSALRCEKVATTRRLQELAQLNQKLQTDLKVSQELSSSLTSELEMLNNNYLQLQTQSTQLEHDLQAEKQLCTYLNQELQDKKLEHQAELTKNQELSARIHSTEAKLFETSDALSILETKEQQLNLSYVELQGSHQVLNDDLSTLQNAFRNKIEELSSLHELLALRTQELDAASIRIEQQQIELEEREKTQASLQSEMETLRQTKESVESDLKRNREDLLEIEREVVRLKSLLHQFHLAERLSVQLYEVFQVHKEKEPEREEYKGSAPKANSFFEGQKVDRSGHLF